VGICKSSNSSAGIYANTPVYEFVDGHSGAPSPSNVSEQWNSAQKIVKRHLYSLGKRKDQDGARSVWLAPTEVNLFEVWDTSSKRLNERTEDNLIIKN
jgi:hypothetical protein